MLGNGILRLCFLCVQPTLQSSKTKGGEMGARVIGEYWVNSCCESSTSAWEDQRVGLETSELLRWSKPHRLLLLGYRHPRVLSCIAWHLQQNQHYHVFLENQDNHVYKSCHNLWHCISTDLSIFCPKMHQQPVGEMKAWWKILLRNMKENERIWKNMKECERLWKTLKE